MSPKTRYARGIGARPKARRRIAGAGPSLSVVDIKSTHPHGPNRTPPYLHAQCAHLALRHFIDAVEERLACRCGARS